MSKIILCQGIQGSGKSTWARQWAEEEPKTRVRWNNDDIRNMLGKYWVTTREHIVNSLRQSFLEDAFDAHYDIVIDDMNLNPKTVKFYEDFVKKYNKTYVNFHYDIEFKKFNTPVEVCIERDSHRPNPIGEQVIRDTYSRYEEIISNWE